MPAARKVSELKAKLFQPSLTSFYEVYIGIPGGNFSQYLNSNGINWNISQDKIQLACCEALLPGSQFATHEVNSDRTGVTERHAYRRNYDDRIDLTFYVDIEPKDAYVSIKFFETWMKYITNESISGSNNVASGNFFYQVKYPNEYYGSLRVTKFERTGSQSQHTGPALIYSFVNAFPLNINSMPISYESSQLLKVTVSFSYIRYYIQNLPGEKAVSNTSPITTPLGQATFNSAPEYFLNPKFGVESSTQGPNDFLNIGNPALDQFGVRDQFGRGAEGTVGANILA